MISYQSARVVLRQPGELRFQKILRLTVPADIKQANSVSFPSKTVSLCPEFRRIHFTGWILNKVSYHLARISHAREIRL